jgi:hypothetical protein
MAELNDIESCEIIARMENERHSSSLPRASTSLPSSSCHQASESIRVVIEQSKNDRCVSLKGNPIRPDFTGPDMAVFMIDKGVSWTIRSHASPNRWKGNSAFGNDCPAILTESNMCHFSLVSKRIRRYMNLLNRWNTIASSVMLFTNVGPFIKTGRLGFSHRDCLTMILLKKPRIFCILLEESLSPSICPLNSQN